MGVKVNSKLFKSKLKQFVAFKTKSDPSSHVKVPMAFYMHFLFYLIPKAMICLMFDKLRNGILSIEKKTLNAYVMFEREVNFWVKLLNLRTRES